MTRSLINSIYEVMIMIVFHGLINARMRIRFILLSFIEKIYIIELSLLRIILIDYSWVYDLKVGLIPWSRSSASYIYDSLMSISKMSLLLMMKFEYNDQDANPYHHCHLSEIEWKSLLIIELRYWFIYSYFVLVVYI